MSWDDINKIGSPEAKEASEKAQANRRQADSDMAKAYNRCFSTDDGKRVLADLYSKMVIGNTPNKDEVNIDYMAAYKDGESGTVTFIQTQITRAEVI